MTAPLRFFSDSARHLVCWPYSVPNLHRMAEQLGIKRCWFHSGVRFAHYDIPKKRVAEIAAKTEYVTPREILNLCKGRSPSRLHP